MVVNLAIACYDDIRTFGGAVIHGLQIGVRALQTWLNKMPDDTRRLHYKAIKKRFDGNLKEDVKMWVQQALQP